MKKNIYMNLNNVILAYIRNLSKNEITIYIKGTPLYIENVKKD